VLKIQTLTGKSEQQRFINQTGVLTNISIRQRSTVSSRPLPEWTDFLCTVCSWTFKCCFNI